MLLTGEQRDFGFLLRARGGCDLRTKDSAKGKEQSAKRKEAPRLEKRRVEHGANFTSSQAERKWKNLALAKRVGFKQMLR